MKLSLRSRAEINGNGCRRNVHALTIALDNGFLNEIGATRARP